MGEKEYKPLTWKEVSIHDNTIGEAITTWDEPITGSIIGLDEFATSTGFTAEFTFEDECREQMIKECKRLCGIALKTKNRRIRKKLIKRIELLIANYQGGLIV